MEVGEEMKSCQVAKKELERKGGKTKPTLLRPTPTLSPPPLSCLQFPESGGGVCFLPSVFHKRPDEERFPKTSDRTTIDLAVFQRITTFRCITLWT